MKLPLDLLGGLDSLAKDKWQKQFVAYGRNRHEGVWRRTQEPKTAKYSGYKTPKDARWRVIHFFDEYDLVKKDDGYCLQLVAPYLSVNTALPEVEIGPYYQKVLHALAGGGWSIIHGKDKYAIDAERGDLSASVRSMDRAAIEEISRRNLPKNYKALDIEVTSNKTNLTDEELFRPWDIMRRPMRIPLKRGHPTVVDGSFSDIKKYMPFHLETGCGPSVEAGVPPLSYLHHIYAVSNPETRNFIIGEKDDLPERLFMDPEAFFHSASLIYTKSMAATPTTKFYKTMRKLYDSGQLLGPVFTNNYDGLLSALGLGEYYMRRLTDSDFFPNVEFDSRAKSLLVVGSHADRRLLQQKARTAGLQVIFVDPESYREQDGNQFKYTIEAPQDEDILIKTTADQFAAMLAKSL